MIRWAKSSEGYVESKCGRFEIAPYFAGRTAPIGFYLYYRSEPTAAREKIPAYAETHRDAKEAAERFLRKQDAEVAAYIAQLTRKDAEDGIE